MPLLSVGRFTSGITALDRSLLESMLVEGVRALGSEETRVRSSGKRAAGLGCLDVQLVLRLMNEAHATEFLVGSERIGLRVTRLESQFPLFLRARDTLLICFVSIVFGAADRLMELEANLVLLGGFYFGVRLLGYLSLWTLRCGQVLLADLVQQSISELVCTVHGHR